MNFAWRQTLLIFTWLASFMEEERLKQRRPAEANDLPEWQGRSTFMGFHTDSFPVCQQCSQLKSMKTGSAILTLLQPFGSLLLKAQILMFYLVPTA